MADIEIAVAVVPPRLETVRHLWRPIVRGHVERMRISVAEQVRKPTPRALDHGELQRVVVRFVDIPQLVNVLQARKCTVEPTPSLLAVSTGDLCRRVGIDLVDVPDAVDLAPMIANIRRLQRKILREPMLKIHVPAGDVGCAQMPVSGEYAARSIPAIDLRYVKNWHVRPPRKICDSRHDARIDLADAIRAARSNSRRSCRDEVQP